MDRDEFLTEVFGRGIEPRCKGTANRGGSYLGCLIHTNLHLYVNAHLDGLARVHLRSDDEAWKAYFLGCRNLVPPDELDSRDNGPGKTASFGAEWTIYAPPSCWGQEVEKALLYVKILLAAGARAGTTA